MSNLFTSIGAVGVLAIVGWGVTGFLVVTGIFGSKYTDRRKESDRLADDLINRLKETVEQQSKDIAELKTQMSTQRAELDHVKGRNSVLEDLFKGRDPGMQQFLKDAPMLMEIAHANNALAKENSEAVSHLTDTLSTFFERLEPMLPTTS